MPATAFAMIAQTCDAYDGLGYPIVIALAVVVIGIFMVANTYKRDIFATNEDGSASATDWRPGKWSPVHRGFRRRGATPGAFCVWFSARHRLL